ncbi:hypothetical protein PNH38_00060 [Anoxybacillus rupiensis]|uniref:Secreted protein n=1 Tax=Anoxybacteroides rupiense TaxID=311460 RepID=A0ABT5VYW0_9BACL|nr:hypothetical protein [Anoxybacillus rupiensis]
MKVALHLFSAIGAIAALLPLRPLFMAKSNVQRIGFFAAVDNIQHGHAVFSCSIFVMINRLKNAKPDKNQAKNGKNRVAPNGESRVMENV